MPEVIFDGHPLGAGHPPLIVAELSANHGGRLDRALALVRAAKDAGADAVKLQTYTADTLTLDDDGPGFRIESGLWRGRTLHDLYDEAHTPWEWHPALFAEARNLGLTVFSSPFDDAAVTLLEGLGAPAFKIASFELVDLPLIRRAARSGRPLVMSTGMADADEISDALAAAAPAPVILLHCVSAYPAPIKAMNLRALPALADRFGVPAGLSDHSQGPVAAIAATALGAVMIEKHFCLDRGDGGLDAAFSLEPAEFRDMATAVRAAAAALGAGELGVAADEAGGRAYRRSLYVVADVAAGERLTADHIRSIRPGHGLAPKHWGTVLGRRAARPLRRGEPLAWEMLSPEEP